MFLFRTAVLFQCASAATQEKLTCASHTDPCTEGEKQPDETECIDCPTECCKAPNAQTCAPVQCTEGMEKQPDETECTDCPTECCTAAEIVKTAEKTCAGFKGTCAKGQVKKNDDEVCKACDTTDCCTTTEKKGTCADFSATCAEGHVKKNDDEVCKACDKTDCCKPKGEEPPACDKDMKCTDKKKHCMALPAKETTSRRLAAKDPKKGCEDVKNDCTAKKGKKCDEIAGCGAKDGDKDACDFDPTKGCVCSASMARIFVAMIALFL